ncbi:S8 family serine peptidase [Streptomyces sp. NPDC048257]|uniref:S8 family serine peptidase n=1 Tax=Streptomyces sp. NPDC048257 TaxID=3365526 RepID=UPI00371DE461
MAGVRAAHGRALPGLGADRTSDLAGPAADRAGRSTTGTAQQDHPSAAAGKVLTVAASNQYDEESDFSDHGTCVPLYAPGEAAVSARLGGGSVALDGTSLVAPHVTGAAVLYDASLVRVSERGIVSPVRVNFPGPVPEAGIRADAWE